MNKSKGMKVVSLFVGILLSMALIQTAFAQSGNDAATGNEMLANATIYNSITPPDEIIVNPVNQQSISTNISAGSGTQFTYSFTNIENKTLILTPKVVVTPNSRNNISENWITISPVNATVAPGSVQNFVVEVAIPRETESGDYRATIAFTDDLLPNTTEYVNSLQIDVTVQALSKLHLDTQYLSDTIDAGKEYEYKISMKNVASKDVTIDPKILKYNNNYDPNYEPAFNSDAIEISAPSFVKAGGIANMTIKVKVPANATGRYYGTIGMYINGEIAPIFGNNNPQLTLDFNVVKQSPFPYVKTFKTENSDPITIEISTDTSDNSWLQSPSKEDPSFELELTHNRTPVNMTLVKSIESDSIGIGGYNPSAASLFGGLMSLFGGYSTAMGGSIDNSKVYHNYSKHYAKTYAIPGAAGDWELKILPKNTQAFGCSITVGDSNYSKFTN